MNDHNEYAVAIVKEECIVEDVPREVSRIRAFLKMYIKYNTWHLNRLRHLFYSSCCSMYLSPCLYTSPALIRYIIL